MNSYRIVPLLTVSEDLQYLHAWGHDVCQCPSFLDDDDEKFLCWSCVEGRFFEKIVNVTHQLSKNDRETPDPAGTELIIIFVSAASSLESLLGNSVQVCDFEIFVRRNQLMALWSHFYLLINDLPFFLFGWMFAVSQA